MMNKPRWYLPRVLGGLILAAVNTPLLAYTPDSEVVRALLDRAVKVLEEEEHSEPGGKALMALALLKAGASPSHPKVQSAAEAARQLAASAYRGDIGYNCYNAAICCLFLIDLDHARYRTEIQSLLDGISDRQRPNGCWNYNPPSDYDDTSQSQYGVLALWAGHAHGFAIASESVVSALNWFMRTQDLSGGWTYRAKDPKSYQRIEQAAPTSSMSAAPCAASHSEKTSRGCQIPVG
jgi:hypothetical protein